MNQEQKADTKARILDAAERLFAHHGFAATSLRQITAEAQANLAAVNYHFQSKESLIEAVLLRKIGPVNQRRLELLDEAERSGNLSVEEIYRTFFQPLFEAGQQGVDLASFPRLLARVYSDEQEHLVPLFRTTFAPVVLRYRAAFERALPGMKPAHFLLSMHFSVGSMAHFLGAGRLLEVMGGPATPVPSHSDVLEALVRFCSAGLRGVAAGRQAL
jgi:AcrR family transcriptional regulator